jgi:hypothetical protein
MKNASYKIFYCIYVGQFYWAIQHKHKWSTSKLLEHKQSHRLQSNPVTADMFLHLTFTNNHTHTHTHVHLHTYTPTFTLTHTHTHTRTHTHTYLHTIHNSYLYIQSKSQAKSQAQASTSIWKQQKKYTLQLKQTIVLTQVLRIWYFINSVEDFSLNLSNSHYSTK